MTPHKTLLDRWHKEEGKHAALRELLQNPLLQEAIAIVQAEAMPDPTVAANTLRLRNFQDAGAVLSHMHAHKAGIQNALNRLHSLSQPPPKSPAADLSDPYDYVNEEYFNTEPK